MTWYSRTIPLLATAALIAGCSEQPADLQPTTSRPAFSAVSAESVLATALSDLNANLAAAGAQVAVARAEFSLSEPSADAVTTVYANDRQLRLTSRWVAGDERRGHGNEVTYGYFLPLALANGSINSVPPIDRSMATWNAVQCSNLPLVKLTVPAGEIPSLFFGSGNLPSVDIAQLGFLPGVYFDAFLGAGASNSVLGVTFTFVWGNFDGNGNFIPSDIDNDGRNDSAFKEIWYNNKFAWSDNGAPGKQDIETVALHENGHALELGHMGRVAVTNGMLKVSPRAVMNAFILGTLHEPLGTDNASYCGNFSSWPN